VGRLAGQILSENSVSEVELDTTIFYAKPGYLRANCGLMIRTRPSAEGTGYTTRIEPCVCHWSGRISAQRRTTHGLRS
jgi:hypothetical protein